MAQCLDASCISTTTSRVTDQPSVTQITAEEETWAFSLSTYAYLVPGSSDYVQPTFAADRGALHLEARYNYEALETGSAWLGWNFAGGQKLAWELSPLLGGIFGRTMGLAPGFRASASWWKLEPSSEGEYVVDTGDSAESFLYLWSELSLAPVEWFRLGGVVQRTKVYQTDFDVQRGLLVGVFFEHVDLTAYVFNPDNDPTFAFAVAIDF